jgi:hypothetical protein
MRPCRSPSATPARGIIPKPTEETPISDPSPREPLWLRIVRHPAVRLLVLGALMFLAMIFSNTFMCFQLKHERAWVRAP